MQTHRHVSMKGMRSTSCKSQLTHHAIHTRRIKHSMATPSQSVSSLMTLPFAASSLLLRRRAAQLTAAAQVPQPTCPACSSCPAYPSCPASLACLAALQMPCKPCLIPACPACLACPAFPDLSACRSLPALPCLPRLCCLPCLPCLILPALPARANAWPCFWLFQIGASDVTHYRNTSGVDDGMTQSIAIQHNPTQSIRVWCGFVKTNRVRMHCNENMSNLKMHQS